LRPCCHSAHRWARYNGHEGRSHERASLSGIVSEGGDRPPFAHPILSP
jgi:hypothetical protein